jgi:hypothetical protein
MFIEQRWENESHEALIKEFFAWLSPWLLLLDFLKVPQRAQLESAARKHARVVRQLGTDNSLTFRIRRRSGFSRE